MRDDTCGEGGRLVKFRPKEREKRKGLTKGKRKREKKGELGTFGGFSTVCSDKSKGGMDFWKIHLGANDENLW